MSTIFTPIACIFTALCVLSSCTPALTGSLSNNRPLFENHRSSVSGSQQAQLAQMDSLPALKLIRAPDQAILILSSDHLFKRFSPTFRPQAVLTLKQLLTIIRKTNTVQSIDVRAYTDDIWSQEKARRITQRQANNIAAYLWANGIPSRLISVWGSTNRASISQNHSALGRAQNRHVEITLNYQTRLPLG